MHAITRTRARVFGGINFGDLVKNSPIRQIKIPAKVSGYTVFYVLAITLIKQTLSQAKLNTQYL